MDRIRSLSEEAAEIGISPVDLIESVNRTYGRLVKRDTPHSAPHRFASMTEADLDQFIETFDPEKASAADLAEAIRFVKKVWKSAGVKAQERAERRKKRGALKAYARMYRKRNRAKIRKKMAKLSRRFGGWAGLQKQREKLRRVRKRIITVAPATPKKEELERLKAEMFESVVDVADGPGFSPYEEAVIQAGHLSMLLSEVFEVVGNTALAEKLWVASESAADLSDAMGLCFEHEDVADENEVAMEAIFGVVEEALKEYEAIGAPTLFEVFDIVGLDDNDATGV